MKLAQEFIEKIQSLAAEYERHDKQTNEADEALRDYVEGYMKEHSMEESAEEIMNIIHYLPGGYFRFTMFERYHELTGVVSQNAERESSCAAENDIDDDERQAAQNKARLARDLPACARKMHDLEVQLNGTPDTFGDWLRIILEINEDFVDPVADVAEGIYMSFQDSIEHCGVDIARTLFNASTIVLPTEIRAAAQYLKAGGKFENLKVLADSGIFMDAPENANENMWVQVAQFLENGGAAEDAGYILHKWERENAAFHDEQAPQFNMQ